MKPIYLLDSDPRYHLLAKRLAEEGHKVSFRLKKEEDPGVYLFSLGAKEDTILPALEEIKEGSKVLVGKSTPALCNKAKEKGINLCPALEDEIYLVQNAKATAEGVLKHVIECCPAVLSDLAVLVYGFGHCGSEIARLLWLCGCEVFVTSRERGCKAAEAEGFNIYPAASLGLSMFDAVVNTVPDAIFSPALLDTLREDAHFFQVASGLSGIDGEYLAGRNVFFHPLPRLPGRYAPKSEAEALYNLIFSK